MSERKKRRNPGDAMVRRAFARVGEAHEPRIDGLIAAVPSISPAVADQVVADHEERPFEVPVRLSLVPSGA